MIKSWIRSKLHYDRYLITFMFREHSKNYIYFYMVTEIASAKAGLGHHVLKMMIMVYIDLIYLVDDVPPYSYPQL